MQTKTQKNLIIAGIALATVVFVVLFLVVVVQIFKIGPLKRQKAQLQTQLEQILEDQKNTQDAINYVKGNKFLEEYARDILGYGKPGEIQFVPKS